MEIRLKISIKELLRCGCSGTYTQRHLQELYRLVYTIAHRLVRRKMLSGKLPFHVVGLSEADVTHDCIVEIFKLGDNNELSEICKYFNYQRLSIEEEDDGSLLAHLRRLVFTIVNDNIFRLYNEADPALGKIIRNIKIAIPNQARLRTVNRFDEQYLELSSGDGLKVCSMMDDDFMQHEIFEIMMTEHDIPRILDRFAAILEGQNLYQRRMSLIGLAIAVKKGYEYHNAERSKESPRVEERMQVGETERLIERTCAQLGKEMEPRYVGKNKVDRETFCIYMEVIKRSLTSEFTDGTDGQISYFDHYAGCSPGITRKEYFERHRVVIEYLGRISKKRVKAGLKEIL